MCVFVRQKFYRARKVWMNFDTTAQSAVLITDTELRANRASLKRPNK